MSTHSINKFELTFRGNLRRFNFYTYSQLIKNHVNLGGFLKEIKGTAFWFLYAKKQDFVFLNLMPTLLLLRSTARIVEEVIFGRGKFMFVNNDSHLFWGAMHAALECGESFCVSGWVGGTLTNFKKLFFFFSRFLKHTDWDLLTNPRARLRFSLQGFSYLSGPPRLIFINNLKHSPNVANEAHAVFIPAIGLVDIDTNSGDAAYLIPSNDDSKISLDFFNHLFGRLILGCKLKMARNFLMRKSKREENFLNNQQISFWLKMFKFRLAFEEMHTKSYKLYLRNWIALSGFRKAFSGVFVDNFLSKKVESFVFKNLKNKPYYHYKKLRTLRVLKNKANTLYKSYYKRFFFLKDGTLNVKYSIQMEYLMHIAKWFVLSKQRLCKKKKWFNKYLKFFKTNYYKEILQKTLPLSKIQNFLSLYRYFNSFFKKFKTYYTSFFVKHYQTLHTILVVWNKQKLTQQNTMSKLKKDVFFKNKNSVSNRNYNFRQKIDFNKQSKETKINPKLKGLRYWMAVFDTKPWLKAKEPLYFLHYPANFKKFLMQKSHLHSFLTSLKNQNLKQKAIRKFTPVPVDIKYNIVDYYELIPENLRLYYYYMDLKYNKSYFVNKFNFLKQDIVKNDKIIESDNGLINLLNFKTILKKQKEEEERLVKEQVKKSELEFLNGDLFISPAKKFQRQFKARRVGFHLTKTNKTYDWPGFYFLSQLKKKHHMPFKSSLLRARYNLFLRQYKYVDFFYKFNLKLRSLDLNISSNFEKKTKGLLQINPITTFLYKLSYYTYIVQKFPENIKALYLSKIDTTKLSKSHIYIKYKNRDLKKTHKYDRNKVNNKYGRPYNNKKVFSKMSVTKKFKSFGKYKKKLFVKGSDWLTWYGRNIIRLSNFFVKKLLSRYIRIIRRLNYLVKKKTVTINHNILFFLQHRVFIILLLKGFNCVSKKDRKYFRQILSQEYYTNSLYKHFFNKRWVFKAFYKLKKHKLKYTSFLRFLLNIKMKALIWPNESKWSFNANYSSSFLDKKYFFNKSTQTIAKDRILKNFRFFFGENWVHGKRWSNMYVGIPTRKVLFFRKLETSKFYKIKKRKLILKPRAYLTGKTLLESFLNDVQYGRVKGTDHVYILREIVTRIQSLKKRKWLVFMQMLKNNKQVEKPFLKNDLDKFVHPKIFLLRNYGTQKFKRVKKQDAIEKKSYIDWFYTQQMTYRSFPGRMDTEYILRLWGNKSMFLTT